MAEQDDSNIRVDRNLRRALESDSATVDRLVRDALRAADAERAGAPGRARSWPWRWTPATVLAGLLLVLARFAPEPPEPGPAPGAGEPAARALRISNENGAVTVTAPAGSTLIILPGDPS